MTVNIIIKLSQDISHICKNHDLNLFDKTSSTKLKNGYFNYLKKIKPQ